MSPPEHSPDARVALAGGEGPGLDREQRVRALEAENAALREQVAALSRELEASRQGEHKSRLFTNVSHELRTPLTLSLAPLEELLHRGHELSQTSREHYLQTIHRNQLRLLRLINNLLEVSKLDAGKMTLACQLCDVARQLRFLLSTLEAAAQARRVSLSFTSSSDRVLVFVDPEKLENIAMNLLSNALKFTPDGGRIEVAVREGEGRVELSVSDNGPGIDPRALPHIFERFSQGKSPERRRNEGSGIGLSMVRDLVELHGGSISVESQPGRGATFVVSLRTGSDHLDPEWLVTGNGELDSVRPDLLVDLDAPPATKPPQQPHDDSPSTLQSSELRGFSEGIVLVVDDVADMREFISHVLSPSHIVETARDGLEGLEKARYLQPDVIVADVMMPRMSGYELCRAVRSDPDLARTPFVLLSARTDMARKLEGLARGADDYLVKPFNASELRTRVRNLVRLRHQERELFNALRALEERDALTTNDLEQAREFQQSILPSAPAVPGLELEALYRPLDLVGGDIYDIDVPRPGVLRLFLADATGHGVKASLATMFIKSEYELIKGPDTSPAELLARLNERFSSTYGNLAMRFSALCLEVDTNQGSLRYATAAHPGPIVARRGEATQLASGGSFVGLTSEASFPEYVEPFSPGSAVYVVTDGVTDEWNPLGEPFGDERLLRVIAQVSSQGALAGSFVYDQVDAFIGPGRAFYDDMTLLGVFWSDGAAPHRETA